MRKTVAVVGERLERKASSLLCTKARRNQHYAFIQILSAVKHLHCKPNSSRFGKTSWYWRKSRRGRSVCREGKIIFVWPWRFCQWGCGDLEHGCSHWPDTGGCLVSLGHRCLVLVLMSNMSSYWGRWWAAKYFRTFGSIPPSSPTREIAEIGK